jgi:hypothetical protein
MKETKTETVAIKVKPADKELIVKLAAEKDITVSKLLYNLLIKGLKEDKQ